MHIKQETTRNEERKKYHGMKAETALKQGDRRQISELFDMERRNGQWQSERCWSREKCGERTQNGLFKRD